MKLMSLVAALSLQTAIAQAAPPAAPVLVSLTPDQTFVPRSFDDNDNAQITVTGNYSSTCFRMAPPIVEVDHTLRQVRVQNRAFYYESAICQRMLVPYVQTIDVGVLRAKSYQISFQTTEGEWSSASRIAIAPAKTSSPDDYLYAPVLDARVESTDVGSRKTLIVSGTLPNGCMSAPEMRVAYRASDVIEVLPISTLKAGPCTQAVTPFEVRAELAPGWEGATLVHIRSLNGQSLNKVTEF